MIELRLRRLRAFASCGPSAQNAAPATISASASPKCYACHAFARPSREVLTSATISRAPSRARQHPVTLDSCQTLPLPQKKIAKMQRLLPLPRLRQQHLSRAQHPVPLDSCHMLPLPQKAQNAAPATDSAMASPKRYACHDFACPEPWHLQSATPATISRAPTTNDKSNLFQGESTNGLW